MRDGWRAAVFGTLLAVFVLLYVWRMSGRLVVEPVTAHLSNAYLSGAAVTLAAGPRGFVDPAHRRRVLLVAAVLLLVNLVGEVLVGAVGVDDEVNRALGGVNTSDPADAVAGTAAVAGVVALLPWRRAATAEPL